MSFDKEFEHSEKLYEAALEEFIACGYETASINAILSKAGMSKGQFYYHFKNKEGLYLALVDIMLEKKQVFFTSAMTLEDLDQDIFSIFQTQIRYGMAFAREHPAVNRFSESFIREQGNPIYEKVLAIHSFEGNQAVTALIEGAYANGEFREDLPLSFIKGIIGYLFTHIPDMLELTNITNIEEQMDHLVTFLKNGLAKNI